MFLTLSQFLAHFPPLEISREDFLQTFRVTYKGNPTLQSLFNLESAIKTTDDYRYQHREEIADYFYDLAVTGRHRYLTEFYKCYFQFINPYEMKWDGVDIESYRDHHYDDEEFRSSVDTYRQSFQLSRGFKNALKSRVETQKIKALVSSRIADPKNVNNISMQKNDASRRVIRNLNYLDILHFTEITNTCKCKTSFWQTLLNFYNHLILEDRLFCPSSIEQFFQDKVDRDTGLPMTNYNLFYYLIQGYQPKASIINPYTINWILKHHLDGPRLLTPVLSWSSYLLAFMHTDTYTEYVGIDVMPEVVDRTRFLYNYYQSDLWDGLGEDDPRRDLIRSKSIDLWCRPSETLVDDSDWCGQYTSYFDSVLMCPPYFDMEIYPTGEQSINTFKTYSEWLAGYWEPTVKLSLKSLKSGGKFAFIVNNYFTLKGQSYYLIEDLNAIALKYFDLLTCFTLTNRGSPLRMNTKNRTEMLYIYVKP